ncbi:hypothetical protein PHJA_002332800 [Phtheirospermum japonicum]|uniref:Uncharacterized protein n=1 Tax=Phtheirospermum japonicum TaxID=374723 RepID=A0A830CWD3_9LAMI|nr:hypothetical protein PHJA_002332800 [Phtheirospermum japonicum]
MIKRRFYRFDHGNKDDPSGSSSSPSDSESEGEATDETEVEEDQDEVEVEEDDDDEENIGSDIREKLEASSSSGYESEDSSVNEVNLDSSGLPTSDDDVAAQDDGQSIIGSFSSGKGDTELAPAQQSPEKDETGFDATDCVLKRKSVFRCRLCPRIRHARSEKLRKDGRLKVILNDDGLLEGESLSDNPGRTVIFGQKPAKPKRKSKGPGKPKKRARQGTKFGKRRPSTDKLQKRRRNDS